MKKALCALSLVVALNGFAFVTLAATPHHSPARHPAHAVKTAGKPSAPEKGKEKAVVDTTNYREVDPLTLVKNPDKWQNENVAFGATFMSFSPYALDYKGAMRSSKDYISFLIQRPDVTHHTIPLSELKLVYPRKKVDKIMDLESGDKVQLKGKVFSNALGDPWMDINDVVITQKSPENLAKAKKKAKKKDKDVE